MSAAPSHPLAGSHRLASIDAYRGLVLLLRHARHLVDPLLDASEEFLREDLTGRRKIRLTERDLRELPFQVFIKMVQWESH